MSGSEEDASFASADEGEEAVKKSTPPTDVKKTKGSDKEDNERKAKSPAATTKKEEPKKGKKKGKGGSQTSPRKDPEETKSTTSTSKAKTSPKKQSPSKPKAVASDKKEDQHVSDSSKETEKLSTDDNSASKKETEKLSTDDNSALKKDPEAVPSKTEDESADRSVEDASDSEDNKAPPGPGVSSPQGQKISRENKAGHTAEQEEVLKDLGESGKKPSGGGWGWGDWGSSLLATASSSVTTFTNQVGDGITTIMDTVENSLGVPEPGELREEHLREEQRLAAETVKEGVQPPVTNQPADTKESVKPREDGDRREDGKAPAAEGKDSSWFSSWGVADLAKKVQEKGKNLASKGQTLMAEGFDAVENIAAGGIDVLENIGKKTYNTLSEHDHNLRKTRDFLTAKGKKPNLSGVLRDAKVRAEAEAEEQQENEEARKAHFGTLFDDYQGIAHLEALEILSNQSEKKVHSLLNSLSSDDLVGFKPQLIAIKEAFEINEDEEEPDTEQDFTSLVSQHLSELELGTAPDKLNKVHEMVKQWINDFDASESRGAENVKSVHQRSIQSLAELTSKGVEQFHKAGEMVLMDDKDKDCTERAHSLARLTGVLCHEVGNLSSKFADCLNKMAEQEENGDEVTALVTNVYLEATNSSTYLQDAFQLLLPVLQHAALEHAINSRSQS